MKPRTRSVRTGRLAIYLGFVAALALIEAGGLLFPGAWPASRGFRIGTAGLVLLVAVLAVEAFIYRAEQRLRTLNTLARRVCPPFELPDVLDTALGRAATVARADAACLRLIERGGGWRLVGSVRANPDYTAQEKGITREQGVFDAAEESGEPVLLDRVSGAPDLEGLLGRRGVRAAVVVPVTTGRKMLGALVLAYGRPPGRLPALTMETLRVIGTQVASALSIADAREELVREARTDPLTGVGSRRLFQDLYRHELARARRTLRPLSLAMIDVDGLKAINDTFGHPAGDQLLKTLGELLLGVRASDIVARYGGDEFVVLMPETRMEDAEIVVQRIRKRLREFNAEERLPFPIRVSIGVRELTAVDGDLVAEADRAMYQEKQLARQPFPTADHEDRSFATQEEPFKRTGTEG